MHILLIIALWVFILPTAIGILCLIIYGLYILLRNIFESKKQKTIRELSNVKNPFKN